MTAQTALCLAATSQALTAFALGFTAPGNLVRPAIALVVAWLTWIFNQAIDDALPSRLHIAMISTGMWIQFLKSLDDLCLTKVSFGDEETTAKKSPPRLGLPYLGCALVSATFGICALSAQHTRSPKFRLGHPLPQHYLTFRPVAKKY
ncbi:hypothetical protein NXS19_002654 [Fusarium pseudograminearum]|nr:hypothetical protein NXS19_002654 [Fusarium pseudograminearum]